MDAALLGFLGVITGSALSQIGTLINSFITLRKEEKQWKRQRHIDELNWQREDQKRETDYLKELYQKSILSLTLFISNEKSSPSNEEKEKEAQLIEDIYNWLTLLSLRHSDKILQDYFEKFAYSPDSIYADPLRKRILELARKESVFFLIHSSESDDTSYQANKPSDSREISLRVDDQFRREQLINGCEIPQRYTFSYSLSDMTSSQRKKLISLYFDSHKTIPTQIQLKVPLYDMSQQKVFLNGKEWQASLNPISTEASEILLAWEAAYDQNLEVVKTESLQNLQNDKH